MDKDRSSTKSLLMHVRRFYRKCGIRNPLMTALRESYERLPAYTRLTAILVVVGLVCSCLAGEPEETSSSSSEWTKRTSTASGLNRAGKYQEAAAYCSLLIADIAAQKPEQDSVLMGMAVAELAASYFPLGRVEEADSLFALALSLISEPSSASTYHAVWYIQTLLGHYWVLKSRHKMDEAESTILRAVKLAEAHFGRESPPARECYMIAADFYHRQKGQVKKAIPWYESELAALKGYAGLQDTLTLKAIRYLAFAYSSAGSFDSALTIVTDNLDSLRSLPETDHYAVSFLLDALAIPYTVTGDFEGASRRLGASFDYAEEHLGPNDPVVIDELEKYCGVLQKAGRVQEARQTYERMLVTVERQSGESTSRGTLQNYLRSFAAFLRGIGEDDRATVLERRADRITPSAPDE